MDEAPVGENLGFWLLVRPILSSPLPWAGWLLGWIGMICCWQERHRDVGIGCLSAACHGSLLLAVLRFSDWILIGSCSPLQLDTLWWELGTILLPTTGVVVASLPPLLNRRTRRLYLPAVPSVLLGFAAATLLVFGVSVVLFTPTATLRGFLR